MSPLATRTAKLSIHAMETGFAAAVTIAARTPIMWATLASPTPANLVETRLMFSEKMDASVEGSIAAGQAICLFWLRAAFGGICKPDDLARAINDVATAATRPAHKRVRANAKRLTREARSTR